MTRPAPLAFVIAMAFTATADAQDIWWRGLNGRYLGQAASGGQMASVTTNLRAQPEGGLVGAYMFVEPGGISYTGTIDSCISPNRLTLRCRWVDRYGNGALEMTFQADLSSFSGQWGGGQATAWHRWDGARTGPAEN